MPSQFEVHRAKDCAIFKLPCGIPAEADEIIKVAAIEANTIYFIVSLQLFRPPAPRPKRRTMLSLRNPVLVEGHADRLLLWPDDVTGNVRAIGPEDKVECLWRYASLAYPRDEHCQSAMGSASDPRRTPQARHRYRTDQRGQVRGQATRPAVPRLEDIPPQSR